MEANDEKAPIFNVVTNFMEGVPDAATREELYDLLGDHPMFTAELLARYRPFKLRSQHTEIRKR